MKTLSVSQIKDKLNTKIIGREVLLLEETTSTNTVAKELAQNGADEGTVVIATRQTMGKGRMGRSFFSPRDKGIYMSVILRPDFAKARGLTITSMTAVAVAKAIEKVSRAKPKIKWVNDIYLNNKKICGILTEGTINPQTQAPCHMILGIGINVKKAEFPQELWDIATSIENETANKVSRSELIGEILNELDSLYKTYESGEFFKDYKERSMVLGREIKVIRGNDSYFAIAEDIDENGGLILNRKGEREVLSSGEVSVRINEN